MSISTNISAGSKKIGAESAGFNPTILLSLYELDFTEYGTNRDDLDIATISFAGTIQPPYNITTPSYDPNNLDEAGVLRFHNLTINLENVSSNLYNGDLFGQLIWKSKRYIPFPIYTEGFEVASRGTLPKPKIRFSNQIQNTSYNSFFRIIKQRIKSIGDIVGLKVTRRRTFLRYLDAINFKSSGGIINDDDFVTDPDPYAELLPDVYYIDRKTQENKNVIEYEMTSILDLENLKLPLRTIYSESCSFDYRGEGCEYSETSSPYGATRRNTGKPVATEKDEIITSLLNVANLTPGTPLLWSKTDPPYTYSKGQYVYIEANGIKYYFVSKIDGNTTSPYNTNFWIADQCSKRLKGCRFRYGGSNGDLPFGGFPATNKEL